MAEPNAVPVLILNERAKGGGGGVGGEKHPNRRNGSFRLKEARPRKQPRQQGGKGSLGSEGFEQWGTSAGGPARCAEKSEVVERHASGAPSPTKRRKERGDWQRWRTLREREGRGEDWPKGQARSIDSGPEPGQRR